jgi:hypothetical protein
MLSMDKRYADCRREIPMKAGREQAAEKSTGIGQKHGHEIPSILPRRHHGGHP